MELNLVNPDPRYDPPRFEPPPHSGWVHLGATVAPPRRGPFVRSDTTRTALVRRLTAGAAQLQDHAGVRQVAVFEAVLMPPADSRVARPARFDVALLVETATSEAAAGLPDDPTFRALLDALRTASSHLHVMGARCTRLLAPVEQSRDGLYLFNHFAPADGPADPELATALWEHLAAWYVVETGLANSTLLAPTGPSDFVLVNHARFDTSLPALAASQFGKRSFRSFVLANLRAHHLVAMPALYRLASSPKEGR